MPFPAVHSLLTMSGPLYGSERWSMGLRLTRIDPGGDLAVAEQRAEPIFDAVEAVWGGNFGVGNQAPLDLLKLNNINLDGRYLNDYTVLREFPTPVVPQGGASNMPPQVSCVVTLETGITRGLACRGRIFFPAPVASVGADGRMPQAAADAIRAGARFLINSINAAAGQGDRVIVASDVRGGAIREVTAVSVGRVLDTMRSRRTSLEEERASLAVTAPA